MAIMAWSAFLDPSHLRYLVASVVDARCYAPLLAHHVSSCTTLYIVADTKHLRPWKVEQSFL